MKVTVGGLVWMPLNELSVQQVYNLKNQLTVQPKKTTNLGNQEEPPPIFLFEEREEEGLIGIPRGYYRRAITKKHEEVLDISYGFPMRKEATEFTRWRAEGRFAEQETVLKTFEHLSEGHKWGGHLLEAGCAFGKALAHGEPVLTPSGYVSIEKLSVGDVVAGTDGGFHKVVGVYPQGKRKCYRVTFTDGTHVDCDEDHSWTFERRQSRGKAVTITTEELFQSELSVDSGRIFWLPDTETICFPDGTSIPDTGSDDQKPDEWRRRTDRAVENVYPLAGKRYATCISVDSPDRLFLTRGCVPTHNTATALEYARRKGRRTLILVHQEFFIDQWKKRINYFLPGARVGIIRQNKKQYEDVDFSIGMLQSLARDVDGTKYPKDMYEAFGLVINDECFVQNTIVKTVDGDKRIDEVSVGDVVMNAVGVGEVKRVFSKLSPVESMRMATMSDGNEILCTKDHKWLTPEGWIPASEMEGKKALTNDDSIGTMLRYGTQKNIDMSYLRNTEFGKSREEVLFSGMHRDSEEKSLRDVRTMWSRESEAGPESILFEKLCSEMDKRESRKVFRESFRGSQEVAQGESPRPNRGVGEDDSEEPNAFRTYEGKAIRDTPKNGTQTSRQRRERDGDDGRPISIAGGIGRTVGTGTRGRYGDKEGEPGEVAESLQAGPSERIRNGGRRGGRGNSRFVESQGCGCEEDPLSKGVRVESVAVPKQEDFERLGVSLVGDRVRVFNLTVSGHPSYVINKNIVVHNCHRVGAASWSNIIPKFKAAWRLGLSATPERLDGAHDVFFNHISEVTYKAESEAAVPKLRVLRTHTELEPIQRGSYHVSTAKLNSAQVLTQLGNDKFRARDVVDQLVLAVKAGRKVMVVSERMAHLKLMSDMLTNSLFDMKLPFEYRIDFYTGEWYCGGKWEKTTKAHKKGSLKTSKRTREELERAESANVIFATKQMVSEGLDIQALDVLVLATPGGNVEQTVGRVRRWCEAEKEKCDRLCPWRTGKCKEKPTPIVMDVVDENIPQLQSKWKRRQAFYRKIGTLGNKQKGIKYGRGDKRQK